MKPIKKQNCRSVLVPISDTEVQFIAVIDDKTSDICMALHGKIFPVGEAPMPPLHGEER